MKCGVYWKKIVAKRDKTFGKNLASVPPADFEKLQKLRPLVQEVPTILTHIADRLVLTERHDFKDKLETYVSDGL